MPLRWPTALGLASAARAFFRDRRRSDVGFRSSRRQLETAHRSVERDGERRLTTHQLAPAQLQALTLSLQSDPQTLWGHRQDEGAPIEGELTFQGLLETRRHHQSKKMMLAVV